MSLGDLQFYNSVPSKQDYLDRLQVAIQQLHRCGAMHRETIPVHEQFEGKTVWQGDVEVFEINGHPVSKRCYAWSHREGDDDDEGERFVTVLEIPPVNSPQTAVQVSILNDLKGKK
jgi:hypothetical protein